VIFMHGSLTTTGDQSPHKSGCLRRDDCSRTKLKIGVAANDQWQQGRSAPTLGRPVGPRRQERAASDASSQTAQRRLLPWRVMQHGRPG